MDNTDKMEDWQMLRVGRKWVVRSRTTREKIKWGWQEQKEFEWVRSAERERAGQIWASVTLGRWLGALSSVYITLTDQAKTAMKQKWTLQHDVCLQVNASCQSVRVQFCEYMFPLHMQPASATVSIYPLRFTRCAYHTRCVWAHRLKLIACFSQEGEG